MVEILREAFEDYRKPEPKRLLWRVWLNAAEPRPMESEFVNQLNTGVRGGVTARA